MTGFVKKTAFPFVFVAALGVFAFFGRAPATGAAYELDVPPKIIAATFSSAWCSACKILEPRLAKVIPQFSDQPVKFVKLDFTFGVGEAAEASAAREGLGEIYPRFKGATGFTVLMNAETGEVIDILTIDHSRLAMRAAIAQALALAQQ